jgi:hypothetical protein
MMGQLPQKNGACVEITLEHLVKYVGTFLGLFHGEQLRGM